MQNLARIINNIPGGVGLGLGWANLLSPTWPGCTSLQLVVFFRSCTLEPFGEKSPPRCASAAECIWADIAVAPVEQSHFTILERSSTFGWVNHCTCAAKDKKPPGGVQTSSQQKPVQVNLHADCHPGFWSADLHHSKWVGRERCSGRGWREDRKAFIRKIKFCKCLTCSSRYLSRLTRRNGQIVSLEQMLDEVNSIYRIPGLNWRHVFI